MEKMGQWLKEQKQKEFPPHPKEEAGLWTRVGGEGTCLRMLQGNNNCANGWEQSGHMEQKTSGEATRRALDRRRKACWGWGGLASFRRDFHESLILGTKIAGEHRAWGAGAARGEDRGSSLEGQEEPGQVSTGREGCREHSAGNRKAWGIPGETVGKREKMSVVGAKDPEGSQTRIYKHSERYIVVSGCFQLLLTENPAKSGLNSAGLDWLMFGKSWHPVAGSRQGRIQGSEATATTLHQHLFILLLKEASS